MELPASAIKAATKRAAHFCNRKDRKLPRHRLRRVLRRIKPEGPGIAAHNYGWLLDGDDYVESLAVISLWAESVNRYCDSNKIEGDLNARLCLLAFLCAQIADYRKL